jgi:RHS repeat-associated protein
LLSLYYIFRKRSSYLLTIPNGGIRNGGEEREAAAVRYTGIQAALYARGEAVGLNRTASPGTRGGSVDLGKDILGSVRSSSNEYGVLEDRYEYDAFGKPYAGDLENGMNLGYTGKPYDAVTGLYNYGYRDYKPEAARFTTMDPVRDGNNWFAYVNNDPVNFVDLWGLWTKNADGTYTAEAGDTLSGLSKLVTGSGNNWVRYEFAGDPAKEIDPRTLQIGSVINVDNIIGFSNSDQAAANIMPKINPTSQAVGLEYGGLTYQQDGKTYYTKPTPGTENKWDPSSQVADTTPGLPQYNLTTGQPISGWYHTHPFILDTNTGQSKYVSEEFSGWVDDPGSPTGFYGDKYMSDATGLPAYMISPTDKMWKYTPDPTRAPNAGIVTPLQNCGH